MTAFSGARPAHRERLVYASGLALALISFGVAVYGAFAALGQNFPVIALAHLAAALTGGAAGSIADRRRLGKHYFPWVVAFTLPLFGGAAAYFLLQNMKNPRTGKLLEEYAIYLDEAASFRESVPVADFSIPTELVSLGDVLANTDSEAEQRVAIEYLAEIQTPAALEILRKGASSAGSEAYFFSMTALTQMEDKLLARVDELEGLIKQAGEGEAEADLLIKTASAYLDFIYYNFVGGEIRTDYLRRAQTLLDHVLNNNSTGASETDNALILAGRVQLALNQGKIALKYFNRYIARNPGQSRGYLWRAEAWHNLRKYPLLLDDCAKAAKMGDVPQNMLAVLDFWLLQNESQTVDATNPV